MILNSFERGTKVTKQINNEVVHQTCNAMVTVPISQSREVSLLSQKATIGLICKSSKDSYFRRTLISASQLEWIVKWKKNRETCSFYCLSVTHTTNQSQHDFFRLDTRLRPWSWRPWPLAETQTCFEGNQYPIHFLLVPGLRPVRA